MLLERRAALGLQKGAVELAPHHPAWQRLFEDERDRLADAIDTDRSRVEHVGSTKTAVTSSFSRPLSTSARSTCTFCSTATRSGRPICAFVMP